MWPQPSGGHTGATSDESDRTKGTALITGASAGIGAVYADRLARRGHDLILVARNTQRLAAQARRMPTKPGGPWRRSRPTSTIVPASTGSKRCCARTRTSPCSSTMPASARRRRCFSSDVDKMDDMISLNVTALTRLTYAAVPGFVARGRGTIINIASIVAISPETLNGVYGGTKAFVLALTHSLQHELADKGVRVQAVLPGATATEFWDIAGGRCISCRSRSSCRRRIWSTRRWPASTWARSSPFPRCRTRPSGTATRPRAARCPGPAVEQPSRSPLQHQTTRAAERITASRADPRMHDQAGSALTWCARGRAKRRRQSSRCSADRATTGFTMTALAPLPKVQILFLATGLAGSLLIRHLGAVCIAANIADIQGGSARDGR